VPLLELELDDGAGWLGVADVAALDEDPEAADESVEGAAGAAVVVAAVVVGA
jgi:hypothetical protein